MNKKGIRVVSIVLASVILAAALCFGLLYKADFVFIAYESIARLTRNYRLEETDISALETGIFTFDELSAQDGVTTDASLMLINSKYTIPDDFEPELVPMGDKQIHACIVDAFSALSEYIYHSYGEELRVSSAYRSAEHQEDVISTSKDDVAAQLGASEHQAGLAVDVGMEGYGGRSFLKTAAGRYINTHSYEFGFIIRYPLLKSDVTGITYEPWHIRFVGIPHAEILYKSGMVLEEYIESLRIGTYYAYGEYLFSRQRTNAIEIPLDYESCVLSYDNTGYCIVTLKCPNRIDGQ